MAGPDDPGDHAPLDDLGAALSGLDAAEVAELDALGASLGELLGDPTPRDLDPVKVGEIWARIEPQIDLRIDP